MIEVARRQFLIAAGGLLAAPLLRAQQKARPYRVAIVLTTSPIAELAGPDPAHSFTRVILHELRALGYVEGRDLIFERRSAEGNPGRYPDILAELIRLKTDAIILSGNIGLIRAAHAATRSIPIVLMSDDDGRAIASGIVSSLARPGGNITGLASIPAVVFGGKMLQLFKEAVPSLSRLAHLGPKVNVEAAGWRRWSEAANSLGITLLPVEAHPTDPEASFAAIAKLRVDGLFVAGSSTTHGQRGEIGRLALAARLPAMSGYDGMVETGGLISYGESDSKHAFDHMRRVAHFVDKILKGANPGDLPMEQPTRFELVINLKTATALGIKIPGSILLRADRVIE